MKTSCTEDNLTGKCRRSLLEKQKKGADRKQNTSTLIKTDTADLASSRGLLKVREVLRVLQDDFVRLILLIIIVLGLSMLCSCSIEAFKGKLHGSQYQTGIQGTYTSSLASFRGSPCIEDVVEVSKDKFIAVILLLIVILCLRVFSLGAVAASKRNLQMMFSSAVELLSLLRQGIQDEERSRLLSGGLLKDSLIRLRGMWNAWSLRIGDVSCRVSTLHEDRFKEKLIPWSGVNLAEIRQKQRTDEDLLLILRWMKNGERSSIEESHKLSPGVQHYLLNWDDLIIYDGLLCRRRTFRSSEELQLIVPNSMREEILCRAHGSLLSRHSGRKKTKAKLLSKFYWYRIREDVKVGVTRCKMCCVKRSLPLNQESTRRS